MLSELPFGSFLTYAPRGEGEAAKEARQWMYFVKTDTVLTGSSGAKAVTSSHIADWLAACIDDTPLRDLLGPMKTLVPVPRSGFQKPGSLWVPNMLATALRQAELGADVWPCLQRATPVPKSAYAGPGQRPNAAVHYDSFVVEDRLNRPSDIVLIDDIVTRGCTLIGAATRIQEACPDANVAAFACMRAVYPGEFKQLRDPCLGRITCSEWGTTSREP